MEDDPYISDHDPCERSQEYRVAIHEGQEASHSIIPQIKWNSGQVGHETKNRKKETVARKNGDKLYLLSQYFPRAKRPPTDKRTYYLPAPDIYITWAECRQVIACWNAVRWYLEYQLGEYNEGEKKNWIWTLVPSVPKTKENEAKNAAARLSHLSIKLAYYGQSQLNSTQTSLTVKGPKELLRRGWYPQMWQQYR